MSDETWNRRNLLKAAGLAGGTALLGGLAPGSLASSDAACGGATETTERTGSLSGADDAVTDSYATVTSDPCRVTLALSSTDATDFDLYVTLDGRTPTTGDFDRKSETSFVSGETVVLEADALDPGATLGILVDSYTAGGSYTLEIEEVASGDGGGTPNEEPTASFSADRATVPVGTEVRFDASGSADPDGSISSYEWAFGDGATATGRTVGHAFSSAGDYTVELTVTDDDGATGAATKTITVESGGGDCGTTETTTKTGTLSGAGDGVTYAYDPKTTDPCGVTLSLSGDSGTDFDLYVTLDGRTPTTSDYDRRSYNYGSDESIELDDGDVTADQTLGILVDSYSGSGAFTLEIEERGSGDGGGETPPPNEGPTAAFGVDETTVAVGTDVRFDAGGSADPDGSIASYEWAFGDGATATGQTVTHAYGSAGEYAVELTVTDDDGASDSASETITVESGGGDCGAVRETASADGTLWGFFGGETYTYDVRTANPCQVTVSLSGPSGADFDLYLTRDGRTPTRNDYDAKSTSSDSQEEVVLTDLAGVSQVGIFVDPASGSGDYTVDVEELGR